MDGLNKRDFINLLGENFNVPNAAIGRVDIKKSYLHFDVEPNFVERLKSGLQKATFNGRKLRVDDATESKDSSDGGRSSFGDKKSYSDRPKSDSGFDRKKKDRDKRKKAW